jgi:hypothetical protein
VANKTVSKLTHIQGIKLESKLWTMLIGPDHDIDECKTYSSIATKIEVEEGWDRWVETAVLIVSEVLWEKE